MSFSLFLRGFSIAIIIFAIVTYFLTQSLATTLINTIICGILIQVGYGLAILWMVARTKPVVKDTQDKQGYAQGHDPSLPKEQGRLGSVPNSRRL